MKRRKIEHHKDASPHTIRFTDDLWKWIITCSNERDKHPSELAQDICKAFMDATKAGLDVFGALETMTAEAKPQNGKTRRPRQTRAE